MNESIQTRTCAKCGTTKGVSEFYKPGRVCKVCKLNYSKAWHEANKVRKQAKAREWQAANRDRIRAAARANYRANPEKFADKRRREVESGRRAELTAAWRKANPEREAANARKWREANRERLNERAREIYAGDREAAAADARRWRAQNRTALRAYWRQRRLDNPDVFTERANARRAQKLATTVGPIDVAGLWEAQGGNCGICGMPIDVDARFPHDLSRSMDHIVPLSRGGTHTADNVRWTHLFCNVSKGARLDSELP